MSRFQNLAATQGPVHSESRTGAFNPARHPWGGEREVSSLPLPKTIRFWRGLVHEFSLAQALVEQVVQELDRLGIQQKVHSVEVAIGVLSGVMPEALTFAFEVLRVDPRLQEARLVIRQVPTRCSCQACGRWVEVSQLVGQCPLCGATEIRFLGGRDLRLEGIEVEDSLPGDST